MPVDRTRLPETGRYALSAGLVWGVDLLSFALLHGTLGIPAAVLVSRAAGGVVGFFAHKLFSFESRTPTTAREVLAYGALWFGNYILAVGGLMLIVRAVPAEPTFVKIFVDILVFAVNYLVVARIFRP